MDETLNESIESASQTNISRTTICLHVSIKICTITPGLMDGPLRSPDLSNLDFSLWGARKAIVQKDPVESEKDLVAKRLCC
ncbi:hypothetical protein CEXT_63541 [Caerostris extrusa]|uniref:Uncharacterized protein n=1 Tax=Caerostris extrusa TaxID=172846 RepID=A0AAV4MQG0_CAEEX|nr:hypothetical protein CEXT_63541 [Caerostris extrusa]